MIKQGALLLAILLAGCASPRGHVQRFAPPARTLAWTATPGASYVVEASPDLRDWSPRARTTTNQLAIVPGQAMEFFRVLTVVTNGATFAWQPSPSPGVVGYRLYCDTNRLEVGLALTATVTQLVSGQAYAFYATAYDAALNESEPSNVVNYSPPVPVPAQLHWQP